MQASMPNVEVGMLSKRFKGKRPNKPKSDLPQQKTTGRDHTPPMS
jgi:hypothetical protein